MQSPVITYLPVFPENPGNPARCEVATGNIEVNNEAFRVLPDYQREFVIEHEKGHYYRQTFDEVTADSYALQQLALKKKNSLWNYVLSVRNISHGDPRRVRAAEIGALKVAAKNGSADAQRLLLNYYANADGGYYLDSIGYGQISTSTTVSMDWNVFAWACFIIVGICIFVIIKKQTNIWQ